MRNLFPKLTKPYYIFTPPYTHVSAGVRALHLLCHALNQSGQKAYLAFTEQPKGLAVNPALNTPWTTPELALLYKDINPIVVYPDIIKGNPTNAKHVVRWLLGYPGLCGGDLTFPDTEQVWAYSAKIARNAKTADILCLPVVDPSIFHKPLMFSADRLGTCYYAHKCETIWGIEPKGVPEGCKKLEGTFEEISDILRHSEMCYIFEDTSVILEAKMCGCPVMFMYNEKFSSNHCEEDWLGSYEDILSRFWEQLDDFIKKTQTKS